MLKPAGRNCTPKLCFQKARKPCDVMDEGFSGKIASLIYSFAELFVR